MHTQRIELLVAVGLVYFNKNISWLRTNTKYIQKYITNWCSREIQSEAITVASHHFTLQLLWHFYCTFFWFQNALDGKMEPYKSPLTEMKRQCQHLSISMFFSYASRPPPPRPSMPSAEEEDASPENSSSEIVI